MNCSNCIYGRHPGEEFNNGCHRYPRPEKTMPGHWCGEWSDVDLDIFTPRKMTAPVKPILRMPTKTK